MCLHLSVALNFIRSHRSCFIFDTLTFFHIVEVFCWISPPPVLQQTQLNRETLKVIKSQTGKSNQVDGLLLQPFHVSLHIIITSPTSHLHSGLIVLELHTHTEEGAAWVTSSIDRDTKTPLLDAGCLPVRTRAQRGSGSSLLCFSSSAFSLHSSFFLFPLWAHTSTHTAKQIQHSCELQMKSQRRSGKQISPLSFKKLGKSFSGEFSS